MSVGRRLHLRLFLEGQEAPVSSATVNIQVGQPAVASISVVATDRIMALKARTLVHLFYLDTSDAAEGVDIDRRANSPTDNIKERSRYGTHSPDRLYKLLFAGEVVNVSLTKTTGSRAAGLQCMDFTSYWSSARHYYKEMFSLPSEQGRTTNFVAAKVSEYDGWFSSPGAEVSKILQTSPVSYKGMTGLLGGIVHLMETIGGVYKGKKQFRGVNDFFNVAEMRLNLAQMIGALEADTTSAKLLNHYKYRRFLTRQIRALGPLANFRDIINAVLAIVHHRTVPNPCAYYQPSGTKTEKVSVTKSVPAADKGVLGTVSGHLESAKSSLKQAHTLSLTLRDASTAEDKPLSRLPAIGGTAVSSGETNPQVNQLINYMIGARGALSLASKALPQLSSKAKTKSTKIGVEIGTLHMSPMFLRPGQQVNLPERIAIAHDTLMRLIKDVKGFNLGKGAQERDREVLPRLYSTLILPDCWFVPPPKCNVLFPEMYSSFHFSRAYLAETTRLQMTTTSEFIPVHASLGPLAPSWGTVKQVYHAPKIKQQVVETMSGSASIAARVLLPHEKFGGIVPDFQSMGNIKQMRVAEPGAKKFEKLGYAQRLANFLFFKKRFGARSLSCTGRFNPHLVAGFPGLIIDRFLTAEQADTFSGTGLSQYLKDVREGKTQSPGQYLGMISSITHAINQQGGTTSIHMTEARSHVERDEYLQADIRTVRRKTRTVRDSAGESGLTKPQEMVKKAIGEIDTFLDSWALGEIDEVGDIQGLLGSAADYAQQAISLSKVPKVKRGCLKARQMLDFASEQASRLSLDKTTSIATLNIDIVLHRVRSARKKLNAVSGITSASTYKSTAEDIPAEDVLRPGWFSSIYTNGLIGEQVYKPLLGIESIVDEMEFRTPDEDKTLKESERQLGLIEDIDRAVEGEIGDILADPDHIFDAVPKFEEMRGVDRKRKKAFLQNLLQNKTLGPISGLSFFEIPHIMSDDDISVEDAVNYLTAVYAFTKTSDSLLSSTQLAEDYTRRPIATLEEVLSGSMGIKAFHANAFGDVEALSGLKSGEFPPAGGKKPKKRVGEDWDPRSDRYQAVSEYLEELRSERGLRG